MQVYAVSGDSVHCHAQWLESTGLRPAFPLLSDTGHALAARLGVPLGQEAGPRCVVITDCVGVVLEMVTSSLDTQELVGAGCRVQGLGSEQLCGQVQYAVDLVALLVEKRRLAVDRDYREKQEMAALLGECCVLRAAVLQCCSAAVLQCRSRL